MNKTMSILTSAMLLTAVAGNCAMAAEENNFDRQFDNYPTYNGEDLELTVDKSGTHFRLWSPKAEEVTLNLYNHGLNGKPSESVEMKFNAADGTWTATLPGQLYGKFYTFRVKQGGKWLDETPGVWAKAVGANGKRAAIVDLDNTDPEGWADDKGPKVDHLSDVILYEMHHRDMSMSPTSGIANKGKFLALTEQETLSPEGLIYNVL